MGSAPATEEVIAAYARDYVDAFGGEVEKRIDDLRRLLANEQPPHQVRLSPFFIARTPLTRAQWRAVLTETPKEWSDQANDGGLPATHIDWPQALTLCNALSAREHLTPCYRRDDQGGWHWDRGAAGYRLPTEAEWEYACRAGTETRWFWGEDPAGAETYAWYSGNSQRSLKPVGGKRKNPWGLHDMAGLVYEWCWDRYGAYPPETDPPALDPAGPDTGEWRVVRGGSFFVPPLFLRPAVRFVVRPVVRDVNLGLRCVRSRARQH
jgi:formylglycine-generating enzyme required for sulfatase activity